MFFLGDVLLDVVEQEGDSAASFISKLLNGDFEVVGVKWASHGHFHFFALGEEVLNAAFSFIAHFDAESVRQGKHLHVSVEVDEVCEVFVSESLDYSPGVIFGNGNAVQFHFLRSRAREASELKKLTTYLNIPISIKQENNYKI